MTEVKHDLDTLRPPFLQRDVIRRTAALGAAACMCLSGGSTNGLETNNRSIQIEGVAQDVQPAPNPEQMKASKLDIAWLPDTVQRFEELIIEAGEEYEVDPELIAVIMTIESAGWVDAESHVGAQGLMQIMPNTEEFIRSQVPRGLEDRDIFNPRTNIAFGAWYLRYVAQWQGVDVSNNPSERAVKLVAAGYNGGPGRADSLRKADLNYEQAGLPNETELYSKKYAAGLWAEKRQQQSQTFKQWRKPREAGGFGGHRLIEKAQQN